MLSKHYLINREDTRGQIIQRFFRSHLRGKWLVDKEPIEQLLDARVFLSCQFQTLPNLPQAPRPL